MPEIKLYNTLSRKLEVFKPIKSGEAGMYNCGPTVYDYAHIGNLRSYIFADILRRTLEYNSFKVKQVINITDVGHLVSNENTGEDRMTKALKRENKPLTLEAMNEVATFYAQAFIEDLKTLNVEQPEQFPLASKHIDDDIDLVKILETKGFTYAISDGIYFDTSKFPSYGKLGNIDMKNLKKGDRIESGGEKRNPADFALWKFDKTLGWNSQWGLGFPGWHIECSVMSRKYLGQPFDIHTGGIDHIPVHHNGEIAQSEAAYGVPLANYWMHNEFLIMNNEKMAKSKGGFITLKTLEENSISPVAYRYWLMTGHYRSPMNFTYEAVKASQNALIRLMSLVGSYTQGGSIIPAYQEKFIAAIDDDLDTPRALALAWELIKDPAHTDTNKRATLLDFDRVFGLGLKSVPKIEDEEIPVEIKVLTEEREAARLKKDWKKADALRIEIEKRGFTLNDSEQGPEIRRREGFRNSDI